MKRLVYRLPLIVIIFIGLCYALMAMMMPLMGDDLGYAHNYSANYDGITALPLIIARHWIHVNSRMADMLNCVWLAVIPRWCLALMCGVMTSAYFFIVARCAHINRQEHWIRMILIVLLLFTMPWWDSFFLFVCQMNYVWSSVLVLAVILAVFYLRVRNQWWLLALPLALVAGWMHEAAGMPAVCGILTYLFINRRQISLPRTAKWLIAAFCCGALMSVTSPASWSRASHVEPNDPLWLLLLKSDFYALILSIFIIIMVVFKRRELINLSRSRWIIFAVAALTSMCISGIGGIVGRSGWFAQTYALIALLWPGLLLRRLIPPYTFLNILTSILALLCCVHITEVTRWQIKADKEITQSLEIYNSSADGTIYMDPIQRYDFPWWNLCKNKGVPDADDAYLLQTINRSIGHDQKLMRVLPVEISGLRSSDITTELRINNGIVTHEMPPIRPRTHITIPFTAADSTTLYYTTPRIIDPGDR